MIRMQWKRTKNRNANCLNVSIFLSQVQKCAPFQWFYGLRQKICGFTGVRTNGLKRPKWELRKRQRFLRSRSKLLILSVIWYITIKNFWIPHWPDSFCLISESALKTKMIIAYTSTFFFFWFLFSNILQCMWKIESLIKVSRFDINLTKPSFLYSRKSLLWTSQTGGSFAICAKFAFATIQCCTKFESFYQTVFWQVKNLIFSTSTTDFFLL